MTVPSAISSATPTSTSTAMVGICSDGPRPETDPASSPAANCSPTMASATRDAGREATAIQARVPRSLDGANGMGTGFEHEKSRAR